MKILICDDEKQYLDILSAHVQEYMGKRFIECEIMQATSPPRSDAAGSTV